MIRAGQAVRVVFYQEQAVPLRDFGQDAHLASHAAVMEGDYGAGALGDMRFHAFLIQIERIRTDIRKNRCCPMDDKGVGRGNKREGGNNDFISGCQIKQQSGHFERAGTGSRQ